MVDRFKEDNDIWPNQTIGVDAATAADLSNEQQAIHELTEAIRLTVEYVGLDTLPPLEGWSWYDALAKYAPAVAQHFVEENEKPRCVCLTKGNACGGGWCYAGCEVCKPTPEYRYVFYIFSEETGQARFPVTLLNEDEAATLARDFPYAFVMMEEVLCT